MHAQRFPDRLDRERRIGVRLAIALGVGPLRGFRSTRWDRRTRPSGRRVSEQQARGASQCPSAPSTFACGNSVRISKIEIIGRNAHEQEHQRRRTGRSCRRTSRSPRSSGSTSPHDEGRKSRCRLRHDDHEPLEPHADAHDERHDEQPGRTGAQPLEPEQSAARRTLQKISAQYDHAYGPGHAVDDHELLVLVARCTSRRTLPSRSRRTTISPVASMTFAMFSRCRIVMKSSSP